MYLLSAGRHIIRGTSVAAVLVCAFADEAWADVYATATPTGIKLTVKLLPMSSAKNSQIAKVVRPTPVAQSVLPALKKTQSTANNLLSTIDRIARQYQLEPALVRAVIRIESAYNDRAVSPKGAVGLMQLMPETAKRFGVSNPYDIEQNIRGGVRYLSWLLNRFNDIQLALAAYNAGEGAVERWDGIPPYRETQRYVQKVLNAYRP